MSTLAAAVLVSLSLVQPPRDFYAKYDTGEGIDQWDYRGTYRTCYYFYRPTASSRYKRQVVYVFYNDPNRHEYVYDESAGQWTGRWESGAYSKLQKNDMRRRLRDVDMNSFPVPVENPAIPESTDKFPRTAPPFPTQ